MYDRWRLWTAWQVTFLWLLGCIYFIAGGLRSVATVDSSKHLGGFVAMTEHYPPGRVMNAISLKSDYD